MYLQKGYRGPISADPFPNERQRSLRCTFAGHWMRWWHGRRWRSRSGTNEAIGLGQGHCPTPIRRRPRRPSWRPLWWHISRLSWCSLFRQDIADMKTPRLSWPFYWARQPLATVLSDSILLSNCHIVHSSKNSLATFAKWGAKEQKRYVHVFCH